MSGESTAYTETPDFGGVGEDTCSSSSSLPEIVTVVIKSLSTGRVEVQDSLYLDEVS